MSSAELKEAVVRPKLNSSVTPIPSPSKHAFRTMSKRDRSTRPAQSIDYTALLLQIDARLDTLPIAHSIIPSPRTTNPFLSTHGTILLQSNPALASAPTEPSTHFAVHKTLLASQSHTFFLHTCTHPTTKVFAVDADRYTLARLVSCLYYPPR
ncbi:hypothetical protein K458DRAFT_31966 [Lentithecium fluviatile CBS 122367]|uniref:Uncharacterized protein n=1 Tax=Lentithecium fluviatile CBS 122367 TaxID=1168545 RepID=A0A6G1J2L6_9PLEO|nr:hypothetical protein K458DRAFT_31966 [Lentithecium fluviatile CBS 122367]